MMKGTNISGKNRAFAQSKGAKSKRRGKKLTLESGTDSSQMEITNYFSKKGGIIGSGNDKKLGDIPQGDDQISI